MNASGQQPTAPPPASVAEPTAAADAARARLEELDEAPLEEHVGIFDDVQRRLQEGLADLDEG